MGICKVCGNEYDKTFEITMDGKDYTFDTMECAIHALAPVCNNCESKIIGKGIEREGVYYCGDHCAQFHDKSSSKKARIIR